jgi:hypothetical protein
VFCCVTPSFFCLDAKERSKEKIKAIAELAKNPFHCAALK